MLSAMKTMADLHRRASEMAQQASEGKEWSNDEREALALGVRDMAVLVQSLILESKKPHREVPPLPQMK